MSSSKNPYRDGSNYFRLFDYILSKTKFTRAELVEFARQTLKMKETSAEASVTVVLSPRAESTRGDCRGNISAAGHLYYIEKLSRKADKDGNKPEQEYKLRWRPKELDVKTRKDIKSSKSKKSAKKPAKKAKVAKAKPSKKPAPKADKAAVVAPVASAVQDAPADQGGQSSEPVTV
jgi:outer membrane biosynthesis protein TonB